MTILSNLLPHESENFQADSELIHTNMSINMTDTVDFSND